CDLAPTGEGTLSGKLQDDTNPNAPQQTRPAPGMVVRLVDPAWPASAQMLIIGTVDRIEAAPDSPLRQVVIVKPVYSLDRWSEVMIRIAESPATPANPTGGAKTPAKGGKQ